MLNPSYPQTNKIQANLHQSTKSQQHQEIKAQTNQTVVKVQPQCENHHTQTISLTHEQKIQATYNFQHLFRKKSQIFNLSKNKKKLLGKSKGREAIVTDDQDKQSKCVKKGHWNQDENRKYHWFLQLNNKKFIYKQLRRFDKIFKAMSAFIGTREAEQCRSHHQKMQKKCKHFYQIILKLRMEFYGTCSTDAVRTDLQENGYMKESKELLVEGDIMKEMESTKDLEHSVKGEGNEEGDGFGPYINQNDEEDEQEENFECKKQEGEVHMLLGENYEQELNYKMY